MTLPLIKKRREKNLKSLFLGGTETSESYDCFHYRDRGTKKIAHFRMDLEEYGVTKKWGIITEISKEDENNNIARLNVYSKHYVSRGPRVGEVRVYVHFF